MKIGTKTSLKYKLQWVIVHYFTVGKTRPEAVNGLIEEFGISYNYARTIVYNHLCDLKWKRAPYPEFRKKSSKKEDFIVPDIIESEPLPPTE